MDVHPDYLEKEREDTPGVIALPPRIYLIAIIVGFVLQLVRPLSIVNGSWILVVGLLIVVLSVGVSVWSSHMFEQVGTAVNPNQPASSLVQSGPFRYSRNPMYVGLTGLQIGITLALNSMWGLLLLVPTLLLMHYGVILQEEAYMERTFGQAYLDYKQSVRRWF